MELGIDISQHQQTWDEIAKRARFAEDAGFEGAWVFDHFKALYGDPSGPCLEGWTLLAALGAMTERIRLGALVTGVTYRHPSILATEAVTVDHISNGRLELAIGAAWHSEEHNQLGVDFPKASERIARLDEAVQVMDLLMTTDGANFDGRYYQLNDATYNPKPVQKPRPPMWIGGGGEQLTLKVVARRADVWHGFGDAARLKHKSEVVDRYAEEAGRDPKAIRRATSLSISEPWDEVRAIAESVASLGFTYLEVSWPADGYARIEEFVEKVAPDLRSL